MYKNYKSHNLLLSNYPNFMKMKNYSKLIVLFVIIHTSVASFGQKINNSLPAIVIHGGAGVIKKDNISENLEREIRKYMQKALDTGYYILSEQNGTALQAIQGAINILENAPVFNAGKGAVYNSKGEHELDASVMDGKSLNAGAVAGVRSVKNPINAALEVMYHSPHVLLSGKGADDFAQSRGLEMVPNDYFDTERRKIQLQKVKQRENTEGRLPTKNTNKFGTVGAVAIDRSGNIAAGTSTGGMTNKQYGRIGDSPIIGAGTYANNNTCGISCTGHGEYFIRGVVAHDISALMEYKNISLQEAAHTVIMEKLVKMGGDGGIIGIDREGNVLMMFNTEGMYRGYKTSKGSEVKLYKDK